MRRTAILGLVAGILAAAAAPAFACGTCSDFLSESTYEPRSTPPPVSAGDPAARRAELGLHEVTEVWAGHTVTRRGAVTEYGTDTVAMEARTAARRIATVATGESSAYDDAVLGGRMRLSDGRPVGGDIYENFVWNGHDYVRNTYVFFQDDEEIARSRATPTPRPTPAPTPAPASAAPAPRPTIAPTASPRRAAATPARRDTASARRRATPRPTPRRRPARPVRTPAPAPAPTPAPTPTPVPHVIRAGIALAPQADPLPRVEVLRGRRVPLWTRATVDGVPARVLRWRIASGEVTALGPVEGTGEEPLLATWRSIGAPGDVFVVRLRASVDIPGEGIREADAQIEIVIRSPALVE